MFLQPYYPYRPLVYTFCFHVTPTLPPLQNLCIHIPSPCFSTPATATEPSHTRFTTMFLPPRHRYRTFPRKKNPGDKSHWSSFE